MRGIGSVAIISTRAGASGSQTPSISANAHVCGPAAITTTSALNAPRVVTTEVQIRPTDRVVTHDRHELLELMAIQQLPAEAAGLADLRPSSRERQLRL